jgi:uncharacterized protein
MFLSIAPDGEITSCQRLAGRREFSLGNIFDRPTLAALYESHAAKEQRERERRVSEHCADCNIYPVCKGGCYYNAHASGDGDIDPFCEAYKEIHSFIQEKLLEEMQTPENIDAIMRRPAGSDEHPLLRRGAYISLSGKVHPSVIAGNARGVLSLYELSKTNDPHAAAQTCTNKRFAAIPDRPETCLLQCRRTCTSHIRQKTTVIST